MSKGSNAPLYIDNENCRKLYKGGMYYEKNVQYCKFRGQINKKN